MDMTSSVWVLLESSFVSEFCEFCSVGVSYEIQILNSSALAASLMKSPISVESLHWQYLPVVVWRRKEMEGVLCLPGPDEVEVTGNEMEDAMRRLRCERGCEGWRRNMVGGVEGCDSGSCPDEEEEGVSTAPFFISGRGRTSLNR